jgi:hypothetical protein
MISDCHELHSEYCMPLVGKQTAVLVQRVAVQQDPNRNIRLNDNLDILYREPRLQDL